ENKLPAARQKLAEARAQLGSDWSALSDLATQVEAGEADLDRYQHFLDLIDQAHEEETTPLVEVALGADDSSGYKGTETVAVPWGRRPMAAARLLLAALHRYEILERDDWDTILSDGLLGRDQVEDIRRRAYEELLWLADDVVDRQQEHRSGGKLPPQEAARMALVYLKKAENVHRPTQAFYALRARCRKVLGEEAAYQSDRQRADKTSATLAVDHYLRGQTAYNAKRLAEGAKAFQEALHLEATHYWSLMRLGYCLCDLGQGPDDFAGAARVFTGCLMKRPSHAHAYYCRALAYYRLKQYPDAVADYSRAIELNPKFAPAWTNRGATHRRLGDLAKAVADSSQAIELDPREMMAWDHRGDAHRDLGQPAKAVADYSRAIELDQKFAPAWIERGAAYLRLGEPGKAVTDCTKAIELEAKFPPAFPPAFINRGSAFLRLGQPDKAVADCTRAIELGPKEPAAWVIRGNAYQRLGQSAKAITDFSKAVELHPKFAPAWNNRGLAYRDLGERDKAFADFSQAIELDPKLPEAWYNRGRVYRDRGQWDKAVADLSRAIERNPKYG